MGSRKIACEPGDLGQIIGEGSAHEPVLSGSHKTVDQGNFDIGQDKPRRCVRSGAVDHGHPEQAPGQNAVYGDQIGEPFWGPQLCILGPAAGFEYFVEEAASGGEVARTSSASFRLISPMSYRPTISR
jgi:hypothetical protein